MVHAIHIHVSREDILSQLQLLVIRVRLIPRPVNGNWSGYLDAPGVCSGTCGNGNKLQISRTRTCVGATAGGASCPDLGVQC
ncbi:unnamed protein product [Didymodactylos carnosus]|uniref:Uncharacterized protein n=1 Tax=Didymodactylos carnosus TaxID=1234261 RepID=A0A8S2VWD5_9BILA|nr:unnamed protein product [Didymodactylos carnosus]